MKRNHPAVSWLSIPAMILALSTAPRMHAQVIVRHQVDIASGLRDSLIHAVVEPAADPTNAFDGNPYNRVSVAGTDTLSVILQFSTSPRVTKSKVFLVNSGWWLLDCAASLEDLRSRSGSYVLLADSNAFSLVTWDSVQFPQTTAEFVRLRIRMPAVGTVMLGEWILEEERTIMGLKLYPDPIRLIPGGSLHLSAKYVDDQGAVLPDPVAEALDWGTVDTSVASVDANGWITGKLPGGTEVVAVNDPRTLTGRAPVSVESDFSSPNVQPMLVKVALVLLDPQLPTSVKLHQKYGWHDPVALTDRVIFHFGECTEGVVNFQIVQTIVTDTMYSRYLGGPIMTVTEYMDRLSRGELQKPGAAEFDYRELVRHYQFDVARNAGSIDEVWVYSPPYTGMYESQLMGPNAFWWNSPPITDGTSLTKLLSVMGLNFERGSDMAFHSFGHRVESALRYAYFEVTGNDWNPLSPTPTPWDLFTRIDKDIPGGAHVGNIHFPPNSTSDYNYNNTRIVTTYADNWKRYPYLFGQTRQVNYLEWYYDAYDPLAEGQDHIGYLRWWYGHLPRFAGVSDGVLNNWWHYALDYEAAAALARSLSTTSVGERRETGLPAKSHLEQNYPNPFNPETVIRFQVSGISDVRLSVYDLLGREVTVLVNEAKSEGDFSVTFDGSRLASGVYLYRLTAGGFVDTRKMILMK